MVPILLVVLNLLDPNEVELGLSVVPKTLLDFSPKIVFFSSPGGALSNGLLPKTEAEPKVDFDFPRSISDWPKIGFSDWLSTGGGFPKSDPGFDGGWAPKRLLGGVGSGIEGGRPAGFLKIPNEEVSEVDSSFTAVSFDAVKPLDWIQFSTETDQFYHTVILYESYCMTHTV